MSEIETILHKVERPSRGRFHENRGTDYRERMVEMHISEVGFCSGHSASGVFVDEFARTTVAGLYSAGDMANVPTITCSAPSPTARWRASTPSISRARSISRRSMPKQVARERARVLAPTKREDGIPPNQIEYKTRRFVNDYLQPPKVTAKMEIGQRRFGEIREDLETRMVARDSHELMRALEAASILDCAEMAAHASLSAPRAAGASTTQPHRLTEKNDADWFCHTILRKRDGRMVSEKRPITPYIVPIEADERGATTASASASKA